MAEMNLVSGCGPAEVLMLFVLGLVVVMGTGMTLYLIWRRSHGRSD